MIPYLLIFVVIAAMLALTVILAKTTFSLSLDNGRLKVSLGMLKCGVRFDSRGNRLGIFVGNWAHYFKTDGKKEAGEKPGKPKKRKKVKKTGPAPKLHWSTILKIVKAAVLFMAGILSRIKYEEGRLDLQPAMANPALAGMAYGWGQAFTGAWPGLGRVFGFTPLFGSDQGQYSGHLVLSIKNGQVMALTWRLVRNLPIKELVKYLYAKRG